MLPFMIRSLLASLTLLAASQAHAGGAYFEVDVLSFTRAAKGGYRMMVSATPAERERIWPEHYFKQCPQLTVIGRFQLTGRFPEWITKESHEQAVALLESAHREKKPIKLGAMGMGLSNEDPKQPCVFASRALDIHPGREGVRPIMSYYAPV
jgi:hypothetical protein